MPKALAITCADYTAAALREVATRGAVKPASSVAWTGRPCDDWVVRYDAEGIAGLCNRIAAGPKPRLDPSKAAVASWFGEKQTLP